VIPVRVREKNVADRQLLRRRLIEDAARIRACVKDRRIARRRIPDEIGVHRHVLERRIELRQPLHPDFAREVSLLRDRRQRAEVQAEQWSDLARHRRAEFAAAQRLQFREPHARALRDCRFIKLQAANGFSKDVRVSVFERNSHAAE